MKLLNTKEEVLELFDTLYPICRSILGEGYRESLGVLKDYMDLKEDIYDSNSKVLNWIIPQEWVIREAWIKDEAGNKIIDFKENNLHVVNYSDKINTILELEELKKHIYTSSADDDAIPYTMSYYKKRWGFCMSKRQLDGLKPGKYHAYIDSEFIDGTLVVGEAVIPGESDKEILLSSYLCHPSMANNELSGPIVLAMLYQRIQKWEKRKFTYRFVINPETIGSISYLSRHSAELQKSLYAGLILTCLGGSKKLRYKTSRSENSPLDNLVKRKNDKSDSYRIQVFDPTEGSDERQYCSPGFDFPVGQMARLVYSEYKEYHTSLDTKELMGIENIINSCDEIEKLLLELENDTEQTIETSLANERAVGSHFYRNLYPYGEVKLGDYDLYPSINSGGVRQDNENKLINEPWFVKCVMMILSYSDGETSLEYCAKRLDLDLAKLKQVTEILIYKGLLKKL